MWKLRLIELHNLVSPLQQLPIFLSGACMGSPGQSLWTATETCSQNFLSARLWLHFHICSEYKRMITNIWIPTLEHHVESYGPLPNKIILPQTKISNVQFETIRLVLLIQNAATFLRLARSQHLLFVFASVPKLGRRTHIKTGGYIYATGWEQQFFCLDRCPRVHDHVKSPLPQNLDTDKVSWS